MEEQATDASQSLQSLISVTTAAGNVYSASAQDFRSSAVAHYLLLSSTIHQVFVISIQITSCCAVLLRCPAAPAQR
jgi:hypothetical protein